MEDKIYAYPIRVIPFDLGRDLSVIDVSRIDEFFHSRCYEELELSGRQLSILKDCQCRRALSDALSIYIFANGICVFVIKEEKIYIDNYRNFSIAYGENRKKAHSQLFGWKHQYSSLMFETVDTLRKIVLKRTKRSIRVRKSASTEFENKGLSYVMTLSLFEWNNKNSRSFRDYPGWVKSNIYGLLDPSVLYLEDSSKFQSSDEIDFDLEHILGELQIDQDIHDYERHRHLDTYMSWAAVIGIGSIQDTDIEEYVALEVQLQCDWFYVYCLDKTIDDDKKGHSPKDIIGLQKVIYSLDLLDSRLYDFDDSSMPTRILDLQKGMVDTSGLCDNMQKLQRKIKYLLEREKLDGELRQKKIGRSSEILLFIIAFIEIAPTVAGYGEHFFHNAGVLANWLLFVVGVGLFLLRKE